MVKWGSKRTRAQWRSHPLRPKKRGRTTATRKTKRVRFKSRTRSRSRGARRIQRAWRGRKKKRRVVKSKSRSWKKKVNRTVHRLNTFLEPRVIRHGWSPQIGGGMGYDMTTFTPALGFNSGFNRTGMVIQDATSLTPTGLFSWMYDVASDVTPASQALLTPMIRHNPLLYASWGNMSDWNNNPQSAAVNPNRFITGQPRSGQFNGSTPITVGNPTWVGGGWSGGFDQLLQSYYRPFDMLNAMMLLQTNADVVGYKQFPFIPRVEKNFDESANLKSTLGGQSGLQNAKIYQVLRRFETRDGDRLRVKNNYHQFKIECVPDIQMNVPIDKLKSQTPGAPTSAPWATIGPVANVNVSNPSLTYANGSVIGFTAAAKMNDSTGGWQDFPAYLEVKPKWFCKVRFIVAKRQRKQADGAGLNSTLELVGCRRATEPNRNFLFDLSPHIRKYADSVSTAAVPFCKNGDWNNSISYYPFSNPREIAASMYKLNRNESWYKSQLDTLNDHTTTNLPDKTLKIIYDHEVTLKGNKTSLVHTMNTMKGKVLNYMKERPKFASTPSADSGQNATMIPTIVEQEDMQQPYDTEYRLWVVTHCHNCTMQIRGKHIFKFDA